MNDMIQVIERDGKPEWAVVPYQTYIDLVEQAELLQDIQDYDRALEEIERSKVEFLPADMVSAIIHTENPIRVWREHRKLTQQQLSESVAISAAYLSQLETGKRDPSLKVLRDLAAALEIGVDDLLPCVPGE